MRLCRCLVRILALGNDEGAPAQPLVDVVLSKRTLVVAENERLASAGAVVDGEEGVLGERSWSNSFETDVWRGGCPVAGFRLLAADLYNTVS